MAMNSARSFAIASSRCDCSTGECTHSSLNAPVRLPDPAPGQAALVRDLNNVRQQCENEAGCAEDDFTRMAWEGAANTVREALDALTETPAEKP